MDGWLLLEEGRLLNQLAQDRDVLEIGAWKGRSTICLAQTARHVWTIDPHFGDRTAGHDDTTLPTLIQNLQDFNVFDKVTVIVGTSQEMAPILKENSFDVAWIDGDHGQDSVEFDLELALKVLRRPGTIACHDFYMDSVRAAIHNLLPDKLNSQIGQIRFGTI